MNTKANNIQYTESEISQLCVILGSQRNLVTYAVDEVVRGTVEAYQDNIGTIETCIFSTKIDSKKYTNYEPYGESRYFTILSDSVIYLQFWRRHLRKFLFEATIKEMPLLMNTPCIKDLAIWRLKLGK